MENFQNMNNTQCFLKKKVFLSFTKLRKKGLTSYFINLKWLDTKTIEYGLHFGVVFKRRQSLGEFDEYFGLTY